MMTQITQSGAHLQLYQDGYHEALFSYAIDGASAKFAPMYTPNIECRFHRDLFATVHLFNMALQPTYINLNVRSSSEEIVNATPPNDINLYKRYFRSPLLGGAASITTARTRYDDIIKVELPKHHLTYDAMLPEQNDPMDIGAKLYDAGITCQNRDGDWQAYDPSTPELRTMLEVNFPHMQVHLQASSEQRR